MDESVSDILIERAHEADGLSRMAIVSLTAHAMLIAALMLTRTTWQVGRVPPEIKPLMIVLAGGAAPDTGGMTPISGRPVQVEAPPEEKPAPTAPPAPKVPEMVAPEPKKLPKTPPNPVNKPVDKSTARKANSGPELKDGDAPADTGGVAPKFGGLTRPSGGGPSGQAYTDYANFCCPEYLRQMTDLIRRNWNPNQGAGGEVLMKFTIQRDGTLSSVQVEKGSGNPMLDLESQRALLKTRVLPTLPREFTENTLTVHLGFEYQR